MDSLIINYLSKSKGSTIFVVCVFVVQECRKHTYAGDDEDGVQEVSIEEEEEDVEKKVVVLAEDDLGKVCEYLLSLISSPLYMMDFNGFQGRRSKEALLGEIDLFCKSVMDDDEDMDH